MKASHKKAGIWFKRPADDELSQEELDFYTRIREGLEDSMGLEITDTYVIPVSEGSILKYDVTQKMLNDIEAGRIKCLLISRIAHLSRNMYYLMYIADHFTKYEAELISLSEHVDIKTKVGRLLFNKYAALAQEEYDIMKTKNYYPMGYW